MKNTVRILSLFLILTMLLSVCLISCGAPDALGAPDAPDAGGDEGGAPAEEYTLPLEDGYNQLTIYFNHNDTYENCAG